MFSLPRLDFIRTQTREVWRHNHRSIRRWAVRGYQLKVRAELLLHGHQQHRPLIIVGSARSGSNLLVDLLDSHPHITMKNEVLSPWTLTGLGAEYEEVSHSRAMAHLKRSIKHVRTPVSGVKILQHQAMYFNISLPRVEEVLPGTLFLLCYRRSLLEQYVSGLIAEQTGAWVSGEKARVENPRIRISLSDFREYCGAAKSLNMRFIRKELARLNWMPIAYEDFRDSPEHALEQSVFRPLGLKSYALKTSLRKQNRSRLQETIENFEELGEELEAPWAYQDYQRAAPRHDS